MPQQEDCEATLNSDRSTDAKKEGSLVVAAFPAISQQSEKTVSDSLEEQPTKQDSITIANVSASAAAASAAASAATTCSLIAPPPNHHAVVTATTKILCVTCRKRQASKDCPHKCCFKCCSDSFRTGTTGVSSLSQHCPRHAGIRAKQEWRAAVLDRRTDVQRQAAMLRASALPKGRFREDGFQYVGDTVVLWNIRAYYHHLDKDGRPKWRDDARRRARRRKQQEEQDAWVHGSLNNNSNITTEPPAKAQPSKQSVNHHKQPGRIFSSRKRFRQWLEHEFRNRCGGE